MKVEANFLVRAASISGDRVDEEMWRRGGSDVPFHRSGLASSSLPSTRLPATKHRAFTLVELVIVLTIIALLVGIAVPSIRGLQDEAVAREPVAALVKMAREVRSRAMAEQRPYQIAFDARGFHAARFYNPYGESEEFDQLVRELELAADRQEMIDASNERGIDLSADGQPPSIDQVKMEAVREGMQFYETYELPDGVTYQLHYWGEIDWVDMTSSGEFRRWVFQPSGMCQPMEIRIQSERAFFEVAFHPLTGDVKSERGWVE